MAKVDLHAVMGVVSGSIGGLVIVRKRNGTVYLRRKSQKKPKQTVARKEQQTRLGQASSYASMALADPAKKAIYEVAVKGTGRSAQNLAVQDHMRSPVIEDIDLSGYTGRRPETILITAKDDVAVAQLWVVIKDTAGAVLEEGSARPLNGNLTWCYEAQSDAAPGQIVHIEAIATDHAGSRISKCVPHYVPA